MSPLSRSIMTKQMGYNNIAIISFIAFSFVCRVCRWFDSYIAIINMSNSAYKIHVETYILQSMRARASHLRSALSRSISSRSHRMFTEQNEKHAHNSESKTCATFLLLVACYLLGERKKTKNRTNKHIQI